MVINTTAARPMPIAQKALSHGFGLSLLDIAMATVNAIASPLVATEMKLRNRNSAEISPPRGKFWVTPSSKSSGCAPWAVTIPGVCNSMPMPAPPTTVNQNMVTSGAMIDRVMITSRMVRPREIFATYRATIGA
ncbi:hypothetical protein D3C78_1100490 [compost metagenome]